MRILLLDPPGKNKGLNSGLAYLCAILKERHDVSVLDLNNVKLGFCGEPNPDMPPEVLNRSILSAVSDFQPDIFGVSVKTFTAGISSRILQLINSQWPEMLTLAGGPHITLDGKKYIEENKIDIGIQGEGEYSTLQLCNALDQNHDIAHIEGLYFWRNHNLINNPNRNTIADLDAIPFPCYDTFSSVILNDGHLTEYPILTSRGCPFRCSYCSMPLIMGGKWRCHSSKRVINELKNAKSKYHSTSFTVVDDNFTLNLKRVEKICDSLLSNQIRLSWNSQNGIRADRINENLAKKMKRSGCRYVWIGIETADEKVFNTINKGEKLKDIERGIKHLKNAGIGVGGFFIVGLPNSTRKTDLKSVNFARKHGIDGWWFNFVPYPHTEAWDWVQNHGNLLRSIDGALQFGSTNIDPVFDTEEYPKESRIKTYDEIHIKMKYFDRLADPSLKQWAKWLTIFKKVLPYGSGALTSLLLFMLTYPVKNIVRRHRSRSL